MIETGQIEVERRNLFVGAFRSLEVLIDGTIVGSVARNDQLRTDVSPGKHEVMVQFGPCKSDPICVTVESGKKTTVKCCMSASFQGRAIAVIAVILLCLLLNLVKSNQNAVLALAIPLLGLGIYLKFAWYAYPKQQSKNLIYLEVPDSHSTIYEKQEHASSE